MKTETDVTGANKNYEIKLLRNVNKWQLGRRYSCFWLSNKLLCRNGIHIYQLLTIEKNFGHANSHTYMHTDGLGWVVPVLDCVTDLEQGYCFNSIPT